MDFSFLYQDLPLGEEASNPNKKVEPDRTPEELAEALMRWQCSEYEPGHQCHLCDDCKLFKPCSLCVDLRDAASLLLEGAWSLGAEVPPVEAECHHHRITRVCPVCGPQPKGVQD